MKFLIKKFRKDILENIGQFTAISLVISIGIAFFVGLTYSYDTINESINDYYQEANLADISVSFLDVSKDDIDTIKEFEEVEDVQGRFLLEGRVSSDDTITMQSYSSNNSMNIPTLIDGDYPKTDDQIILDSEYVSNNNIKIGDLITVSIGNDQVDYELTVSGVFKSAEYIYYTDDNTIPVPNHTSYAVGIVEDNFFEKLGINYTQALINLSSNADDSELIDKIDSEFSTYLQSTAKEQNVSYQMVANKLESVKNLSVILPIVFIALAAVITSISMSRQIENQREQISVMRAFGISKFDIRVSFLQYPLFTALIGTIVGTIIGVVLFPKILISTLSVLFVFPSLSSVTYIHLSIIGFLVALIAGAIATRMSCRKILKEIPAQGMRPLPPRKAKNSIVERNQLIWNKIPYAYRIIFRNISMNKKRFWLSSIGIIFCVSIMIASIGIKYAFNHIVDTEFDLYRSYDVTATLNEPSFEDKNFKNKDTVEIADLFSVSPVTYNNENTVLNIVNKDTQSNHLYNRNGEEITINDSGIYVSEKFAEENSIGKKDTIELGFNSPVIENKDIEVEILDVYKSYTNQGFYGTFELLDKHDINYPVMSVHLTTSDDAESLKEELDDDPQFSHVTVKDTQKNEYLNASSSIDSLVLIMIAASILLAFTVIYNISSINIFEKRRDIATEKVLGLTLKEINRVIFVENIFLVAFSSIFGILLSYPMYIILCEFIASDEMAFPHSLNLMSIPIAILLTLVSTLITNSFLKRKVKRIDMVESLKGVE
ncbi:ABC transporter permease [Pseudogracilibacillus sp. SO30301A]|uniref:ABC transporter permease n=1 Tax=Pseudogracilibacillus sp. SO30301A TaxID=3098291 RepID=UPI00300E1686